MAWTPTDAERRYLESINSYEPEEYVFLGTFSRLEIADGQIILHPTDVIFPANDYMQTVRIYRWSSLVL